MINQFFRRTNPQVRMPMTPFDSSNSEGLRRRSFPAPGWSQSVERLHPRGSSGVSEPPLLPRLRDPRPFDLARRASRPVAARSVRASLHPKRCVDRDSAQKARSRAALRRSASQPTSGTCPESQVHASRRRPPVALSKPDRSLNEVANRIGGASPVEPLLDGASGEKSVDESRDRGDVGSG